MQVLVYTLAVFAAALLALRIAMVVYMQRRGVYPVGGRGIGALLDRAEDLQRRRDRLVRGESALLERHLMLSNLLGLAARARPVQEPARLEQLRERLDVYEKRFEELEGTIATALHGGTATE